MTDTPHISYDELDLYARGRLQLGQGSAFEAHLSICETCRDRLSRSLGFRVIGLNGAATRPGTTKKERRSEPRFAAGDEAIIQELHPLSTEHRNVVIANVSKSGVGFLTSKFVSPGTIVQVRVGDTIEFGEVRHCLAHGEDGYYIGLRLQHDP